MKNKHKGFGRYLREKRRDAGLSQQNAASALGYSSPQFISNLERGTCPVPLNRIRQFIDLYKIDHDEFVSRFLNEQEIMLRQYIQPHEAMVPTAPSEFQ
jgi:transcriptional regulator with XRE-family HTH domain